MDEFAAKLLTWFDQHGRHDLPWQQNITPYRVWVSEIMLQQTQVTTVIDYFNRFTKRFPTVHNLAEADLDEVLHLWTGLGYYARARNLHKTAQRVVREFNGEFPDTQEELESLPGIGRSTAGAIRAIAQQQVASILDGNVKRVLCRIHAVPGHPGETKVAKVLWQHADAHTPKSRTNHYTQAIMDLGATVCVRKRAKCNECPVTDLCEAHAEARVDEFPHAKPKKEKPTRHARFFVATAPDGSTLLEQMPLEGLWGGLWTPPQRASESTVDDFLNEHGVSPDTVVERYTAPEFRHTFTHFHLKIEPIYLHLSRKPTSVAQSNRYRWHQHGAANNADPIGLSVPAVKLLDAVNHNHFELEAQ
ncbi:MAG: A/G-specific adenine glycosylase [Pseudomonadota bacterium]